jgi:putative transcriptional regulator
MRSTNLTNQFLIAMPGLMDPNFHQTVTYICAHNEEGAMGIVINRPLNFALGEVLTQMELASSNKNIINLPVYHGGPVQTDRGFVLHTMVNDWESSIRVSDSISVTTSRDILESIAEGHGPDHALIALGYAGWAAGQLEQELKENVWLNGPAETDIIFNTPYDRRWEKSAALLGVDLGRISSDIGHA